MRFAYCRLLILLALCVVSPANAHAPRENYVWINLETDHISGRFELNQSDVEHFIDVALGDEDIISDATLLESVPAVQAYLTDRFELSENGRTLELRFGTPTILDENARFLQYHFSADLPDGDVVTVSNQIFLTSDTGTVDKLHRSLVLTSFNKRTNQNFGEAHIALVFQPESEPQDLDLSNPSEILQWKDFFWQGWIHIWIGYDHLLFILVLLLPSVLTSKHREWEAIADFRPAFLKMVKIVTLFTIAHSITLTLAALDILRLNIVLVEVVIAASIIGIALNNIHPRYSEHTWIAIFGFGLFHGMGFASVMGDLPFRNVDIELILLMFNLGVEFGQLAIVVVLFPIFFFLRHTRLYRIVFVRFLSIVAMLVASFWVVGRLGYI